MKGSKEYICDYSDNACPYNDPVAAYHRFVVFRHILSLLFIQKNF